MNFDQAPMLVIWEVTQACDLACVHCRASAQSERNPAELSTEHGYRLLDEIRSFGEPLMVFTGGDLESDTSVWQDGILPYAFFGYFMLCVRIGAEGLCKRSME